jgi:hypothetical protein
MDAVECVVTVSAMLLLHFNDGDEVIDHVVHCGTFYRIVMPHTFNEAD